jgi:thiamine biosynthesis protein ThiS
MLPMNVTVNGTTMEVAQGTTASSLLTQLELDAAPCAVEVNAAVVSFKTRHLHEIASGDVIEIVTLTGGG